MMYQKAVLFEDHLAAEQILSANNPGKVKAIGRQVKGFDQTTWERECFSIVVEGNLAKFNSNQELKKFIVGTGDRVLVEASPVDRIWGIGLSQDDPKCEDPNLWRGKNLLGFALMEVRNQLI
ncbi:NADAR family protein [Sessilibacter corallicola]|uniref:NADAR domain-containing protein n=1 Tax=Sessilibacter corallicola TaxID=2904075 RepID=A0ABQ0A6L8_9GAMM